MKLSDSESSCSEKASEEVHDSEIESAASNDVEEEFLPLPDGSPTFTAVMSELGSTLSKSSLSEHIQIPSLPAFYEEHVPVVKSIHFDLHQIQPHAFSPVTVRKRAVSSVNPDGRARSYSWNFRVKSAADRRNTVSTSSSPRKSSAHSTPTLTRWIIRLFQFDFCVSKVFILIA